MLRFLFLFIQLAADAVLGWAGGLQLSEQEKLWTAAKLSLEIYTINVSFPRE